MSDLKQLEQEQLDFHKVRPLNSNRLVTFVNHFIVSIVQQLNEMTAVVDSRLHSINNKINVCHSNLVILEMKLNSISGLSSLPISDNTTVSNVENNTNSLSQQMDKSSVEIQDNNSSSEVVIPSDIENSDQNQENEEMDEQKDDEEVVVEDPRMAKYKKMLQLGIPLGAVHQKMQTEGVDIDLLKI